MQRELKKVINQPRDVEGQIRAALQSPIKHKKLWIVTESDYDRNVYGRFFNDNVEVRPAYDERGKGGCDNVVRIVNNILKSRETRQILGIRDADYMYYVPSRFNYPAQILHTDERDIEMLMLKAPSVLAALAAWNAAFPAKIAQVIPIACYMGLIRIWHVARDRKASIKRFHISEAWDEQARPQSPTTHWKKVLRDRYNRLTGEHLNAKMVLYIRNAYRLDDTQYGRICRGHDFVQLLGKAMAQSAYSSDKIQEKIAENYSIDDFTQTNLYAGICSFAARFGMAV